MASQRPREADPERHARKQKKGFSVGPANLPDGTYKRKVQKIKKDLIHKAKIKKQFAKLQARQHDEATTPRKSVYDRESDANDTDEPTDPAPQPSLEPHPDRVRMLEEDPPAAEAERSIEGRKRRPRSQPFRKETEVARRKKVDAEARQKARDEAEKERAGRAAERARFRKTMAKARGGPNGQRRLGRESTVLLAKVQRIMNKT